MLFATEIVGCTIQFGVDHYRSYLKCPEISMRSVETTPCLAMSAAVTGTGHRVAKAIPGKGITYEVIGRELAVLEKLLLSCNK